MDSIRPLTKNFKKNLGTLPLLTKCLISHPSTDVPSRNTTVIPPSTPTVTQSTIAPPQSGSSNSATGSFCVSSVLMNPANRSPLADRWAMAPVTSSNRALAFSPLPIKVIQNNDAPPILY